MNEADGFKRLEALFHELDQLDEDARRERMDALAEDDPVVHAELLRLIQPDPQRMRDEQALDSLVGSGGLAASFGEAFVDPDQVGPYRLVRRVGEGGMGRVYLAEQLEPVRRRVALKLTRRGLDSEEAMVRFRAERQALAVLDHPNIARVFDAGNLDDGRPWFAMEYIEGVPITRWAVDRSLGLVDRIRLMLPVCDAVQHAHRKGLIHRDLKPTNILVVQQDGTGVPKVIDFGIARLLEIEPEPSTRLTRLGELVGTPEYMSPEQAALGEIDIDTRSDVYSLGLVLYELLVGQLPISGRELRELGFEGMCRQIREDETARPSRAQPREDSGADSIRMSADEANPTNWRARLKGDLDSVLLKALAKDRDRRYGSVDDLADDLRRYLADEPVVAQPPSLRYRTGKFVRRHRWPVATGLAVASALVGGVVLASYGLLQARDSEQVALRAAEQARIEREAAEETTAFLVDLFRAADPANDPGLSATAEDLLARGEARIGQLAEQPGVQAELLASLGSAYYGLGELTRAEALLRRARSLRDDGVAADDYKRAAVESRLADLLRERSEYEAAAKLYRSALDTLDSLGRLEGADAIVLLNGLGVSELRVGELDAAESTFRKALARLDGLPDSDDAARAEHQNHRLNLLSSLAGLYAAQGRNAEAASATRQVLEVLGSVLPDNHPNIAILHTNLSVLLAADGELLAADREARRSVELSRASLGEQHPRTAIHLLHAGTVQWRLGAFDSAERSAREAIDIFTAQFGETHHELLRPRTLLARVLLHRGEAEAARAEAGRAAALAIESESLPLAYRIDAFQVLGDEALARGDLAGAEAALGRAAGLLAASPEEADEIALGRARISAGLGRMDDAAAQLEAAERSANCLEGPCALDAAADGAFRAELLARMGRTDRAFDALELAIRHPGWTTWMLDLPAFETLQDDRRWPRLEELLTERADRTRDVQE